MSYEIPSVGGGIAAAIIAAAMGASILPAKADVSPDRGAYIFAAGGCATCHTDSKNQGRPLAGGRALPTPFGTFYSPNITPDPTYGIGGWTDADFIRALQQGIAPDGSRYYPAFPYTSFAGMSEQDLLDLKAYLFTQPAVAQPDKPHELKFPFSWRFLVRAWRLLYFSGGDPTAPANPPPEIARGAYLVDVLGHCGECHTPRNMLGAMDRSRWLAGAVDGPGGDVVPNLTPAKTGLADWSASDLETVLESGLTPDADFVIGAMTEVVDSTTSKLTTADRKAIVSYLRALPPIEHKVEKPH